MTSIKKIAAAALCAGLALPSSSQAATIIDSYVVNPGAVVGFLDTFSFTPPTAGRLTVTVTSNQTGPFTNVNFATNGVKLNGVNLNVISTGATELQKLFLSLVTPPTAQVLTVKGSSQANGAYNVTYSFAVPEPATWALMILGFGAVGFAMRRRRQADGGFGALSVA